MARGSAGLTALEVRRRGEVPGTHWVSRRLYLLVATSLSASWIYRYQDAGRKHDHGLGPYPDIPLAEARQARLECDKLRRNGIDPIEARRAKRGQAKLDAAKAMTFEQCGNAYYQAHSPGWRNLRHAQQWLTTLETYVYPMLGGIPVQAVDVSLVMKALEQPIGEDKKPFWLARPETASRVRGRIESVLDWATARGYRQGENPARWRGHLENLLPKRSKLQRVEHHAALPYGEIGAFMAELRRQQGIAARALEFLVLTAGRAGEVAGARWSEIDLPGRLWVVPGKRMKSGKEHRVPLSSAALEILDQMARLRSNEFVFSGRTGRGIGHSSPLKLLARMGRDDLTAHGFRSTFSDWVTECTNFPAEARELALAHKVGDAVVEAYRRGDLFEKRRGLMDAWARFCSAPVADNTDTVVSLTAAR